MTDENSTTDGAEAIVRRHIPPDVVFPNPNVRFPLLTSYLEYRAFQALLEELGAHFDATITSESVLRSIGVRGSAKLAGLAALARVSDNAMLGLAGAAARRVRFLGLGRVAIAVGRNGGRPIAADQAWELMRSAATHAFGANSADASGARGDPEAG